MTVCERFVALVTCGLVLAAAATGVAQETVTYYHTDGIGSVRVVTDAGGNLLQNRDYLPFGEPSPSTPPFEKRGFAGMEKDAETTLNYVGARYYSSGNGRFTSVDPVLPIEDSLLDPQRWNRYVYVRNNPFRYVDPDGRVIESAWDLLSLAMSAKAVWQNPTSGWNWLSLGADVVSVVGPGIPAIGMAIRGGGRIDSAIDTARAVDPQVAKAAVSALESQRARLLRELSNDDLRNVVEQLYRPGAKVGSGSSMDALRHERLTGQLLSPTGHTKKLLDYRTNLMKLWSQRSRLSSVDRRIVRELLTDIQNALDAPIP